MSDEEEEVPPPTDSEAEDAPPVESIAEEPTSATSAPQVSEADAVETTTGELTSDDENQPPPVQAAAAAEANGKASSISVEPKVEGDGSASVDHLGSSANKKHHKKKDDEDSDEEETEEENAEKQAEASDKKSKKRTKHSMSLNLQAEQKKQRLIAFKKGRENRRAQIDKQHYHLIEMLSSHMDVKPKDVEEFLIDSDHYIELLDKFFKKKGSKSIFFIYKETEPPGQESGRPVLLKERMSRILVSDGTDIALEGQVALFVRINNDTKLTMKTVADDTYFQLLDIPDPKEPGIVLDAVVFNLNNLLIPFLQKSNSWVTIPDPELAESIRHKFLTSILHYAEFLSDCKSDISSRLDLAKITDMTELLEKYLNTPEKVLESSKRADIVAKVEQIVIVWCKNIERVLALSKLIRKDTDAMGPNAELAYWRNLHAKMCFIIQQIGQWEFIHFIQVLVHSKSKVLRRWKDVDARVTDDYHESKDNVRYLYALSKFVEPLYQLDPLGMVQYIPSMIYTIQVIHTTSRYYNSCEKVTALLVKISNQMVYACRCYLTKDGGGSIWNQDKRIMIEKLKNCLNLYAIYRASYENTKVALQENPEGKQFNFSVNHIFGRYDLFCERLRKIITLLEIFDMYKFVHESHIDGIEEISLRLKNLFNELLQKTYDPLDFRQSDFDDDFGTIRYSLDEIQKGLEGFMDKSIENCSTAMHCLELLERFSNLRNRCLNIEEKQWYAFQFYFNEINMLKGIYESEKNDTPIPRGFPPFAGKIAWARHLFKRLERPMLYFQHKTSILSREDARPTIQAYNGLAKKLIYYEILFHDAWVKQTNAIYDSLEAPLLIMRVTMRQEMVLNFDPFFRQIIDETEIIRKLDLEVPDVAQIVYHSQDKIFSTSEKMKNLLDRFSAVKSKIPNDLIVLIRGLVKRVEKSFMLGVTNINWSSFKCDEYFEYVGVHLDELESIAERIDEILSVRVNQCLWDICHTLMIDIPQDKPMEVREYLEKIHIYCKIVSKELEYKSRHCESAVQDLINMLIGTNELNAPDEILYGWLNPNLFGKGDKNKDLEFKPGTDKAKKKPPKVARNENLALIALVNELPTQLRDEISHLHEECRHVFMFYSQKCIEALQKTTRTSLDLLRQRTEEPQLNKRAVRKHENKIPLFTSDLIVTIPTISLKPPLEETQRVLSRSVTIITECLKHVIIWGQSRRVSFDADTEESYFKTMLNETSSVDKIVPFERLQLDDAYIKETFDLENLNVKLKNCFKPVMDYKDISKMVVIMQSVVVQSRPKVQTIINKYMSYNYLWKNNRDKELQDFINGAPAITEVQAVMKTYNDLINDIHKIVESHRAGPLEILTQELKSGLIVEVKPWKQIMCKHLNDYYREKVVQIQKFIDDTSKELDLSIKDLKDIKTAMDTLNKIREHFVEQEALLTPIEESYHFLNKESFRLTDEDLNRAMTLRYYFNLLQIKALQVKDKIASLESEHRPKLLESISKFQSDLKSYLSKYKTKGPLNEGITPEEASYRLMMFQDEFSKLFERYKFCNQGEQIFGFVPKEYPEIFKHQKELGTLQKLYGLYNDVMRCADVYTTMKWGLLEVPKLVEELKVLDSRQHKLPLTLQQRPAFLALRKKIDDLEELCPLLEILSNKAMKKRHWERLGELTGFKFDLDNENFSVKHVLACPIVQYKEIVQEIALFAIREEEIESKMKQMGGEGGAEGEGGFFM